MDFISLWGHIREIIPSWGQQHEQHHIMGATTWKISKLPNTPSIPWPDLHIATNDVTNKINGIINLSVVTTQYGIAI